jgi:hypothetical protein
MMRDEAANIGALEVDETTDEPSGEADLGDGAKTKGGSWIDPDSQP